MQDFSLTGHIYYTLALHLLRPIPKAFYSINNPILGALIRIRKIVRHNYGIDFCSELRVKEVDEQGNIIKIEINLLPNSVSIDSHVESEQQCSQQ